MFRKLIIIIFLVFLSSGYARADYESTLAAAEKGDAKAQSSLGFMYSNGEGVTQDYTEALKWYRKAAEQGNAFAQGSLGNMYQQGLGVPQDYVQSYAWFQLATEGGLEEASAARMNLRRTMNSKELEEARKLVRELWEKYGNKNNN